MSASKPSWSAEDDRALNNELPPRESSPHSSLEDVRNAVAEADTWLPPHVHCICGMPNAHHDPSCSVAAWRREQGLRTRDRFDTLKNLEEQLEATQRGLRHAVEHIRDDLQPAFEQLAETGKLPFPWEGPYDEEQAAWRLATWWHGAGVEELLEPSAPGFSGPPTSAGVASQVTRGVTGAEESSPATKSVGRGEAADDGSGKPEYPPEVNRTSSLRADSAPAKRPKEEA